MPRLTPEAPHLYKTPPNVELGAILWAADWPPQMDIPSTPKSVNLALFWGAKEEMCVYWLPGLLYPKRNFPMQTLGGQWCWPQTPVSRGVGPQLAWHPGTQPGWQVGRCSPSCLHTLFSCVSDCVSARRAGLLISGRSFTLPP